MKTRTVFHAKCRSLGMLGLVLIARAAHALPERPAADAEPRRAEKRDVVAVVERYFSRWSNGGRDLDFGVPDEELGALKNELSRMGLESVSHIRWQCEGSPAGDAETCDVSVSLGESLPDSLLAQAEARYSLKPSRGHLVSKRVQVVRR